MEIERKWIVPGLPDYGEFRLRKHRHYTTFYPHVSNDVELRYQKRQKIVDGPMTPCLGTPKFQVTMKVGNGLSREEYETSITEQEFLAAMGQNICMPIEKEYHQYYLPDGHLLEVSQVDGKWFYAEVEFESEEDAKNFKVPDYLANADEVTGQAAYQMKNYWGRTRLAKRTHPAT